MEKKIEYKTEEIDKRKKSEVRICSTNMTEKEAENIIKVFKKVGFDTHLEPEKNKVCVVIKLLEVF